MNFFISFFNKGRVYSEKSNIKGNLSGGRKDASTGDWYKN